MEKGKERKTIKAVMTVEASLILPVFIMLLMNLLSAIEVYRIHSNVAASLWEEGREAAKFLYLRDCADKTAEASGETGDVQWSTLLTSLSAHRRITKNLAAFPVWEKIVVGGKAGFLVSGESEEDGTIQIDCSYRIHPLFAALTPVTKELENHYYGHAWVGYIHSGHSDVQEEVYVYITETGTVYHRNRGCSYLNPSIQCIQQEKLEHLRNKNGAIYYACPLCGGFQAGGNCYITDYGTNYHTSVVCSGLKRTIYEVKLSETGGRGACSKCGG